MAKLCLEEAGGVLGDEELAEAASWVEAGTIADPGPGCEGACGHVRLYARAAR